MDAATQERYLCKEVCARRYEITIQFQGLKRQKRKLNSWCVCLCIHSFNDMSSFINREQFIEIQEKFNLIKRNHLVIDLGAAPGGTEQI